MALNFDNKRILVVEDEIAIIELIADMLLDFGSPHILRARSLADGLDAATTAEIDVALLDVNLAGEACYPIAERLNERGIPFLFVTGYPTVIKAPWQDRIVVEKPFPSRGLGQAIDSAMAGSRKSAA